MRTGPRRLGHVFFARQGYLYLSVYRIAGPSRSPPGDRGHDRSCMYVCDQVDKKNTAANNTNGYICMMYDTLEFYFLVRALTERRGQ